MSDAAQADACPELECQEQEQCTEKAKVSEFRARSEDQRKAQEAREFELLEPIEALKSVQENWTLDQDQIVQNAMNFTGWTAPGAGLQRRRPRATPTWTLLVSIQQYSTADAEVSG